MAEHQNALERPHVKAKVIEYVLLGQSDAQVAAAVSTKSWAVTRQAITAFRHRHAEELAAATARVEREIVDYAIAQKVNRIAAMDDRWQRMKTLIDARATDERYSDEPGYETGLMVHQLKAVGKGEDFQLVDLYVTDAGLLAEMRATERAAADELGQMPKQDANVNVNVAVGVQLVWQDGSPA